jgi:hypothetical protein
VGRFHGGFASDAVVHAGGATNRQVEFMIDRLNDKVADDGSFTLEKVLRAGSNAKFTSLMRSPILLRVAGGSEVRRPTHNLRSTFD